MVEKQEETRIPVTVKASTYWSGTPRAGNTVTPPQESRSVLVIDDETSSGSKSAQELDYDYDCERFFWVLSVGWFLLVAGFLTIQQRQMFHPDPGSLCVVCGGGDVVVF